LEDAGIKVVTDYKPSVAQGVGTSLSQTVIDPISGRAVPLSQLSEHMRIQLMDPRWREQQAISLNRQRETALAEGDSIARSLQAFAQKRGDIFGSAEEEEAQMAMEAAQRAQRMEEANRIIFNDRSIDLASAPMSTPSSLLWQNQVSSTSQLTQAPIPIPPPRPVVSTILPPPPPRPAPILMPQIPVIPPLTAPIISLPPLPLPQVVAPMLPPPPPVPSVSVFAQTEEEFAASHKGTLTIKVQCPVDIVGEAAAWELTGQVVPVTLRGVLAPVRELKDALSGLLGGMPANKQQLRDSSRGFLKDNLSFAFYNLESGSVLELIPRKRGGR
jgi:splicing factor 3A subunit 1